MALYRSPAGKTLILAIFAVATFSVATLTYQQRNGVLADSATVNSDFSLTQAATETLSTTGTLASETDSSLATGEEATPTSAPTPSSNATRYIVLGVDILLILILAVILIIRIVTKIFSQPSMQQPIELGKKDGPVTVDQLNVDIPL